MCKISELVVMVIEPDKTTLQNVCDSLNRIGITHIVCVDNQTDALDALGSNPDIDIILADYNEDSNSSHDIILPLYLKKERPGILLILTSKEYSKSVVINSIRIGAADILDLRRENEVENLMEKWLILAKEKCKFRELLHGKRPA